MFGGETFKASECTGENNKLWPTVCWLIQTEHPGGPRPLLCSVIPSTCPGPSHRKHSEEDVGLIGGETNAIYLDNRAS